MRPVNLNKLSVREQQVAALLQQDFTNQQIADSLGISRRTVNGHLHNIYKTLRLKDNQTARDKVRAAGDGHAQHD